MPLHVPVSKSEIAELSAEEVWQYVMRILTNLSNTRAARIDNLDVLLSTRLPTTTFNSRLSTVRAARIDEITAARLAELDPANIPADIASIPTTPELEADAFIRYVDLAVALALIPTNPEIEADALTRYTALAADILTRLSLVDFNAEMNLIKSISGASGYNRITDSLQTAGEEDHHDTDIFPEDTNKTVTFTAGNPANTFNAWAEIVDNLGAKFSDLITLHTHISSIIIEDTSEKDDAYLLQVSYGDARTPVTCFRFIAGETTKLPAVQQMRIRADLIPPGEKVYYRMKCETAGATCQLHLRWFPHSV